MKRLSLACLVMLSAACTDSNVSSTTTQPGTISLQTGPYRLRVTRGTTGNCFDLGSGPGGDIQLDMSVSTVSGGWRVTLSDAGAGDLVLTLTRQGTGVTGRGDGRGTAGTTSLLLDNALTGNADTAANSATGALIGNVTYRGATGDTVCTDNRWTLAPR